ncbi:MAG: VCBS repeat-containing protein [Armatimonadetes bacterium]|nr:VCBS repeat-containing protein [Armatimonadota bacterium]
MAITVPQHTFPLFVVLASLVGIIAALAAPDPGEWPMIRRDARNLAVSPLKGVMTSAPIVLARYLLGGSPAGGGGGAAGYIPPEGAYLAADLDGDGREEIVMAAGGPVRALSGEGRQLWRTMLSRGQPNLLGIADLDGCGRPEVVCATGMPATIHILSGKDGRVLWERSFDEQVYFMQGTRLADLDGDGKPELFLLGNAAAENSRKVGWAYNFRDGFAKPRRLWGGQALPFNPHYRPQTIVADIDGDGRPEVVIASAVHAGGLGLMVAALDGRSGEVKRTVAFPNGDRNYGHLQAIRTGSKPQLDLLVIGMLGRAHITFLTNDEAGMKETWHTNGTFQIPHNPVADVDGDGKLEIVYMRVSDSDSGGPPRREDAVLTIRDLATGTVKREIPGMRLQGIVDLEGRGRPYLIATTVPEGRIVLRAGGPQAQEVALRGAHLCMTAPQPPIHMMSESLADRSGYNVFARDLDGDGAAEVFIATGERLVALDAGTLASKFEYRWHKGRQLSLLGEARTLRVRRVLKHGRSALLLAGEDGLHIVRPDGVEVARAEMHNLAPRVPIAARLRPGGPMAALVSPANRDLAALDGPSLARRKVRRLWSQPGLGGFESPTVCDIDGDGQQETLACDGDTAEITILDAGGRVKKRLPPLPTDGTPLVTGTCAVGRFGDGSHLMLGAVSGVGPNDGQAKWTTMDPRDGRVWWWREGGPHPRRTPAVWDVNGDGVDDLVYSHYFDLCEADGRTGEYLHYVPNAVAGYHLATVADLDSSGKPSVLLSGGYMRLYRFDLSGKEVWRTPPLDYNAGSAAAVADADGDGQVEAGVAFADRFDCFAMATGKVKWSVHLPGRGSDVVAADIDGDGKPEFLFGCADGRLYAVKAVTGGTQGRVLWKVALGAPVGQPAIVDLDDDGSAEMLVCTQDGYLHVLAARQR